MKRVVETDNFGMSGESPGRNEHFMTEAIPDDIAEKLAKMLNGDDPDAWSMYYYKVVDIDYRLLVFEP